MERFQQNYILTLHIRSGTLIKDNPNLNSYRPKRVFVDI